MNVWRIVICFITVVPGAVGGFFLTGGGHSSFFFKVQRDFFLENIQKCYPQNEKSASTHNV